MHPEMPLVVTLASALGLALVLGFVAVRLGVPALVGYLLAGVLMGPHTPGFVGDVNLAAQLAEIGVMLLMFGVGLHFSVKDLLSVKKVAVPGAIVQMVVASAMGALVARLWGWSWMGGVLFGISLSVASTVVLLRALEARAALESENGRIAVGWLIVEDLAMVLVLVLLPAVAAVSDGASASGMWLALVKTLAAVGGFVALMLLIGRRVLPWVLWQASKTGSRELFTLCVMALAVSIAYGASALFGVSVALGAFFAGLVLRESEFGHRAAEESLPFRDAFAVLFFVSVGMLFDPMVLLERPWQVACVVGIILFGKSLAAAALVLCLRYPLNTALTVSVSLAQIGEFSFILAALGTNLGVLPPEAKSLIVAGALLSIALNPFLFSLVEPLRRWILGRSRLARRFEWPDEPLAQLPASTESKYLQKQVVLVGYGRVGQRIAEGLSQKGVPFIVVEESRERVESLRAAGMMAVYGDAKEPGVLVQAHIAHAGLLVISSTDITDVPPMLSAACKLNPNLKVVSRAGSREEAEFLLQEGVDHVLHPRAVLAEAIVAEVLAQTGGTSSAS